MNIPFPPFEPDKSAFNVAASKNVVNALPVADGWESMPGLTEISVALASECRGAVYVRTAAGKVESAVKDASAALAISAFSYFTNQWGYMLATMGRQMVGRALASPTGRASLNAMLDHPTVVQSASNAALQGLRNDPLVKQATSATVNSARRLTTRGAGVVPEPE